MIVGMLVFVELGLIALCLYPSHIDRPEAGRAWHKWHQNPNADTERAWQLEKNRLRRESVIVETISWSALLVNSICLVWIGRKLFYKNEGTKQRIVM